MYVFQDFDFKNEIVVIRQAGNDADLRSSLQKIKTLVNLKKDRGKTQILFWLR